MRTVTCHGQLSGSARGALDVEELDLPVSSIEDILEIVSILIPASEGPSPNNVRIDWVRLEKRGGGNQRRRRA